MGTNRFQQAKRPDDIGLDEVLRPVNGTINVALCRKIDDGSWSVLRQQFTDALTIGDVGLDKDMAVLVLQTGEIFEIPGIGQLVNVDHGLPHLDKPVQNEIGTNKTGASSNQNHGNVLVESRTTRARATLDYLTVQFLTFRSSSSRPGQA